MQNINKFIVGFLTLTLLLFSGCSGGGGSDSTSEESTVSVNGVAQKGPFVSGSTVTIYKLDDDYNHSTTQVSHTTISDNEGHYTVDVDWTGMSEIVIEGYYLDETTGLTSTQQATLSSIVDIQSGVQTPKNVNLFTHLSSQVVKKLLKEGKSLDEANSEAFGGLVALFGLVDSENIDLSSLDLTELTGDYATVNAELLRISAALLHSDNPLADMEILITLYNSGGIDAVLGSEIYARLQAARYSVDMETTMSNAGIVTDSVSQDTLTIAPAAVITKLLGSPVVELQLYGTKFEDYGTSSPAILSVSPEGSVSVESYEIADDNMSMSLTLSDSSDCSDINVSFLIDYMNLKDVDEPVISNTINLRNPTVLCAPNIDDNSSVVITLPENKNPVAYIGTLDSEELLVESDIDQEEQYTTTAVGVVNSYIGSYSYDRDFYPEGAIVHCQWENNASEIIVESNNAECNLENLVFDRAGVYDYTLRVRDNRDAIDSNVLHISVEANTPPTVTLNPSETQKVSVGETVQINAIVVDADAEDTLHIQWMYSKIGSPVSIGAGISENFSYAFSEIGDYNVSVSVVDSKGARAEASLLVSVVAQNHSPTVSISPSEDRYIQAGETILLKSSASDEDGDTLTIAWKLKELEDSAFTYVANYGTTGFSYTFDTVGTYLVVVEAEDENGAKADANITVSVSPAPAIVTTLADINISVEVKKSIAVDTGIAHLVTVVIDENATHGVTSAYLVGGEFWSLSYESIDCFIGNDTFIYKSGDDYGRVNVTVTSPSNLSVLSETKTLFNTDSIEGEYLRAKSSNESVTITQAASHGDFSLTEVGNEIINYNYTPESSFVGNDYVEYSVSETIDSCLYSESGRLDFIVQEYVPQTKLLGICQDPYTIGKELYKTDGTLSGTSLVKNINYNERDGVSGFLSDEYKIGNLLFFGAYDGDSELWQSDGVNTYENKINNTYEPESRGNSYPQCFNMINGKLYFTATNGDSTQYGIYIADGVTVTRLSDNKPSGNEYNYCSEMRYNSETSSIYFWENDKIDSNISRLQKANMDFSTVETIVTYEGYEHNAIATLGEDIFYQVRPKNLITSGSSNLEIWMKSPTANAIEILNGEYQFVQRMVTAEGKVYAMGRLKAFNDDVFDDENRKMRLFEITATGAREVLNTINGDMRYIEYLDGSIYFMAWHFDPNTYDEFWDLYRYNIGTQEKTLLKTITRMEEGNPNHERPMLQDMFKFEDKIVVRSIYVDSGDNPLTRDQLWVSDGTVDGTVVMHENIISETETSVAYNFFTINGEHFMQDKDLNVYKTDYTFNGTSLVIPNSCDITPDNFNVESQVNYELNTLYEQNATITGLTYSATKVSIDNGEYSIGDRTHWTTDESTIDNGQIIYFRHTSSTEYATAVRSTLYIGDMDKVFETVTKSQ